MARPEFCKTAGCKLWTSFCAYDERYIRANWPSQKGRIKERNRLQKEALHDPNVIENRCQTELDYVKF